MDILKIPDLTTIAYIVAISGAVSWAGSSILKKVVQSLLKYKKIPHEPWWYNPGLRTLSIILGAVAGYFICNDNKIVCLMIGAASGAMNTMIVMLLKKYIKKKSDE